MKIKKSSFSKVLLIIFFLSSFISLFAQSSKIGGNVTDAQTGEALVGANVVVQGTSLGAAANLDGDYLIVGISPGEYQLKASYLGYDDQIVTVTAVAGRKLELDLQLKYSGSTELGEEVVVTGQARGQMNAINEQLNSKSIKNVLSAERMQELPDANAAETIGRLPGVSVLRSGGEGNKVVVRGLSPKYNKITLEGVSMASTSASDRSTDISGISPYSLDGVEVIKAATADHDADFLGGAVNFKLRTADPGWKTSFVVQGGYNDLKSTLNDYMFVGSVSNRFFDNKFGAYLQLNLEQRNRSSNNLNASYFVRQGAVVGENNPVYMSNFSTTDAIRERSRYGATLVLDYAITDGAIKFKNFFSQTGSNVDRYVQTLAGRLHTYEGRREQYDLGVFSNILDYEQRFDQIKIDAKLSHSYSKNELPKSVSFQFNQREDVLPTEVLNASIPPYEVIKYATLNDSLTFLEKIIDGSQMTEERQIETALNLQYDFSISNQINGNVKIGGKYRYKDRLHDRTSWGANLRIGGGRSIVSVLDTYPWMREELGLEPDEVQKLPYYLLNDPNFDHKNFLDGKYNMGAVADLKFLEELLSVLHEKDTGNDDNYPYEKSSNTYDYSGNEYYYAGYAMAELNIGKYIKLIPGARYEKNKTVYTGVRGVTDLTLQEFVYDRHDTTMTRINEFLLPMIHLKVSPLDWFDIRFAYTQTLSRPSYNQIMPRMDVNVDRIPWNNYKLEPEFSENFDLYLSFQENYLGLFTVGAFIKKIDNMIFNLGRRVIVDTAAYDFPAEYFGRDIYTSANNQYQAEVKGIEVDWQTNFWYLPGFLKGLVLNINYTHIESEAKYPFTRVENLAEGPFDPPEWANIDSFYTSQLIDQPDDIINVQLGYDYKGFSTRVSMSYASSIFKNPNFWPELSYHADEYLRWDLSVQQKLPWYGMQLFLNWNNITSAQDRDYVQGANWDAQIQNYGMTMDLGLRIKL
ncbi:MAG: TonB-dependent receptor [Bacteroidota bacterium]